LELPDHVTLDEARLLLRGITAAQWTKILSQRSDRFRREEIDVDLSDDLDWQEAWRPLNKWERRAVVALASLSDGADNVEQSLEVLVLRLASVGAIQPVPFFVWIKAVGLGLVVELSEDIEDCALAWIWNTNDYREVELGACRAVVNSPENAVLALEARAFW